MKTNKVLIYSDCYIYGGSERLMVSLLKNKIINENYLLQYAYRTHRLYRKGLSSEYPNGEWKQFFGLNLISFDTLFYRIRRFKIWNFITKGMIFPFWFFSKLGIIDLYNFIILYIFIKKLNPTIVHINNGGYPASRTCRTMVFAAWLAGCKKIIMQVNNQALQSRNPFLLWLDKKINNRISYFITASIEARRTLADNRSFPIDKIELIYNTVLSEKILKSKEQICTELDLPIDAYLLCEVAFLEHRKGQHTLIEALFLLKDKEPVIFQNTYIILVGDGIEYHNLKLLVEKYHLQEHTRFVGYRIDSIDFINACDIFILPSIANEDMPLVILSAMRLGKNIISTNFAGIREEIENGISGILLKPDENKLPEALMRAIVRLFKFSGKYGEEAKYRFESFFSESIYGQNITSVYNQLLK